MGVFVCVFVCVGGCVVCVCVCCVWCMSIDVGIVKLYGVEHC